MSPEQRKIARHALGLDNPDAKGRSYRNRYCAGRGHAAWGDLHAMVAAGWVKFEGLPNSRLTLFSLTREGAELALDPGETLDPEDFS